MSAIRRLRYKFRKYILHKQKVNPISDSDNDNRNKPPFVSVAIKVRAEQVLLVMPSRSNEKEHSELKGRFGGNVNMNGGSPPLY